MNIHILKNYINNSTNPRVTNFFLQAQQKTSEACGNSIGSVKIITSETTKTPLDSETKSPTFTSLRKTLKRIKYATDIDNFDQDDVV